MFFKRVQRLESVCSGGRVTEGGVQKVLPLGRACCSATLLRHNAQLSLDKSAEMAWPHRIPGLNEATV
jgi:hypothetical protein